MRVFGGFVGRHKVLVVAQKVTEVERGTAKKGQVFQLSAAAKIYHAHEVADGRGVAYACRELVVDLVHVDDHTGHAVEIGVIVGKSLCLFEENGGSQDQVVGLGDGVHVLVGQQFPSFYGIGRSRLEQHIAFFGMFVGCKNKVTTTQHTFLHDGIQRRSHLPKTIVGIGVLHPNGALFVSKLTRHQAEKEITVGQLQLPPPEKFDIVEIEQSRGVSRHAQEKRSRVSLECDLLLELGDFAIIVIALFQNCHMVGHMVVGHPSIVIHVAIGDAPQHAGPDNQRLGLHQIGELERDGKRKAFGREHLAKPVLPEVERRKQFFLVPEEIGKFGDDSRGIFDRQGGLLANSHTILATVDAQIIIGGVGVIIALAPIGLVAVVDQDPPCRLLTIEQHLVAFIKTTVVGTCHTNGHLCQVVGA